MGCLGRGEHGTTISLANEVVDACDAACAGDDILLPRTHRVFLISVFPEDGPFDPEHRCRFPFPRSQCSFSLPDFHHQRRMVLWKSTDRAHAGEQVAPLLEKYNVDAYLCGHDHTQQHIENAGVQYYVSGRAEWNRSRPVVPICFCPRALAAHGGDLLWFVSNVVTWFAAPGAGALRGSVKPISTTLFAAVDPGFMVHQVRELPLRLGG
jgi:hypothetical protein